MGDGLAYSLSAMASLFALGDLRGLRLVRHGHAALAQRANRQVCIHDGLAAQPCSGRSQRSLLKRAQSALPGTDPHFESFLCPVQGDITKASSICSWAQLLCREGR
jgi:hypothetical protein